MKGKFLYADRHRLFPNTIIISYSFSWGGQLANRIYWMSELNEEVDDYYHQKYLVEDAIERKINYVVLRVHKDGSASILESNTKKEKYNEWKNNNFKI